MKKIVIAATFLGLAAVSGSSYATEAAPSCPKAIKEEARAEFNSAIANVRKERAELVALTKKNREEELKARKELSAARVAAIKAFLSMAKAGGEAKKAHSLLAKIDRLEDRLDFLKLREHQNSVDVDAAKAEVDTLKKNGGSPGNIREAEGDLAEEQRELAATKSALTAASSQLSAAKAELDKLCK